MEVSGFHFKSVIAIDFEFYAPAGENPRPLCLVAKNFVTGETHRYWEDELVQMARAPFDVGPDTLCLAYYASAEMNCFLYLKWQNPSRIVDLFAEFRCVTNNKVVAGHSILDALKWFGLEGIEIARKDDMRQLAMRGGRYTEEEKQNLMDYCETDVIALENLFLKMKSAIDLPRAIFRGRFMAAAAKIEFNGIPIDVPRLREIESNWPEIQTALIRRVNDEFGVYEGLSFRGHLFVDYLNRNNMRWPTLPSGSLDLKEQTFEDMAKIYPQITTLHELRSALAQMRSSSLPVGVDGRNRTLLSAFRSVTGRSQPKSKSFIFGRSAWFRHLIAPENGRAVAYVDWSQQEFGIAGALSGDTAMIDAYASGDPYLEFGKQAGAIPPDGTKKTHGKEREQFKQCALAVLYGGGAGLIGMRTGLSQVEAKDLILAHRKSYPKFWSWINTAVDSAMLGKGLQTVFGWQYHSSPKTKHGTILNFPMQANGAEMMRLAACLLTENGIKVCAPVHDAFLIEDSVENIEESVSNAQDLMANASRIVLADKLTLRSDAKIIAHPNRYEDERGTKMWETVLSILNELRCSKDSQQSASNMRMNALPLLDRRAPVQSPLNSPKKS